MDGAMPVVLARYLDHADNHGLYTLIISLAATVLSFPVVWLLASLVDGGARLGGRFLAHHNARYYRTFDSALARRQVGADRIQWTCGSANQAANGLLFYTSNDSSLALPNPLC